MSLHIFVHAVDPSTNAKAKCFRARPSRFGFTPEIPTDDENETNFSRTSINQGPLVNDTSLSAIMSGKFEPKHKVDLDPPKDDIIGLDYLSKCDGL